MRMDAARALADGTTSISSQRTSRASTALIDEYIASQRFNAERPEAQVNLANFFLARGHVGEAEAALLKAIESTRASYRRRSLWLSCAEPRDKSELPRPHFAAPSNDTQIRGALLHALGLSLVRQKRTEEAVKSLREAAQLSAGNAPVCVRGRCRIARYRQADRGNASPRSGG